MSNNLKHHSITATELVRNLSRVIDEVRISGQSVLITKGIQAVAELRPPPKPGYPIDKLPDLFNTFPKLGQDSNAMSATITSIKKQAKLPENPWD